MKEVREKNEAELQKLLASSREKLRDLRFKVANKQLKDVREIRVVKKTISRILTKLNSQKEQKPGSKGNQTKKLIDKK